MPHFYFKVMLPTVFILLMLTLAARALATTQPPSLALRGFTEGCEDKPQPCWYGIVPGKTTAEAAYQRLSQLGYEIDDAIFGNTRQLQARFPNGADCGQITANVDQRIGLLYEFYVHACDMPLGDFFSAFATPMVANLEHEPCSIRLLFQNDQVHVTVTHTTRLLQYVAGFGLLSDETVNFDLIRDSDRLPWSGTLPFWNYKNRLATRFKCV